MSSVYIYDPALNKAVPARSESVVVIYSRMVAKVPQFALPIFFEDTSVGVGSQVEIPLGVIPTSKFSGIPALVPGLNNWFQDTHLDVDTPPNEIFTQVSADNFAVLDTYRAINPQIPNTIMSIVPQFMMSENYILGQAETAIWRPTPFPTGNVVHGFIADSQAWYLRGSISYPVPVTDGQAYALGLIISGLYDESA